MKDPSFLPLLHGFFYPFFFCGSQGQVEGQSGRRGGGELGLVSLRWRIAPPLGTPSGPEGLVWFCAEAP